MNKDRQSIIDCFSPTMREVAEIDNRYLSERKAYLYDIKYYIKDGEIEFDLEPYHDFRSSPLVISDLLKDYISVYDLPYNISTFQDFLLYLEDAVRFISLRMECPFKDIKLSYREAQIEDGRCDSDDYYFTAQYVDLLVVMVELYESQDTFLERELSINKESEKQLKQTKSNVKLKTIV